MSLRKLFTTIQHILLYTTLNGFFLNILCDFVSFTIYYLNSNYSILYSMCGLLFQLCNSVICIVFRNENIFVIQKYCALMAQGHSTVFLSRPVYVCRSINIIKIKILVSCDPTRKFPNYYNVYMMLIFTTYWA